jgi:hypothetical protein
MQKWAEQMIKKANQFTDKIEASREKWMAKTEEERVQTLVRNVASHQARREQVVDKLEARFSEENRERMRETREKALESSDRLIKATKNGNLSEATKEHLEQVQARIEDHLETVRLYQEKKMELLKEAATGDEGAKEELKQLWEERKAKLEGIREDFKEWVEEKKEDRKETATSTVVSATTTTSTVVNSDDEDEDDDSNRPTSTPRGNGRGNSD